MTGLEALEKIEDYYNWSSEENIDKDLYDLWGNVACRTIKKELEVLEIIKKNFIDYGSLDGAKVQIIVPKTKMTFNKDLLTYEGSKEAYEDYVKVMRWLLNEYE